LELSLPEADSADDHSMARGGRKKGYHVSFSIIGRPYPILQRYLVTEIKGIFAVVRENVEDLLIGKLLIRDVLGRSMVDFVGELDNTPTGLGMKLDAFADFNLVGGGIVSGRILHHVNDVVCHGSMSFRGLIRRLENILG
jgi:hypothetical protein